jgi:hypothetical protein
MGSSVRVLKRAVLLCAAVAFVCFWDPLGMWNEGAALAGALQAPGPRYVGVAVCAECHESKATVQQQTAMGRALELPASSEILRAFPRLAFKSGKFTYQIVRQGDQSIYSVSDGTNTISEPILYAFGQGKAGQTYVYKRGTIYYESRVSYYKDIKGLDITIGHAAPVEVPLVEALGRALSADEVRDCFACHSTAALTAKKELQLDHMVPGVGCEACHGPGSEHVLAMNAGDYKETKISNPGKLSGDELTQDFCAKCHRSAEAVAFMPKNAGINNVRFQPYRIFNSKCYSDDKRISCVACHNPHEDPSHEASFYDAKCLACHVSKGAKIQLAADAPKPADPACPVGTKNCSTCHMPKIGLPGSHFDFTDHRIRVVKPGEPFPE